MLVGTVKAINIGDYIQAVAAEQFFDQIDTYIERERLDEYQGEPIRMIMNGWFMHEPKHWPPAKNINPLFVAFHINSLAKDRLLAPESINYLKKYEPIGCRDLGTVDLLKSKGIDAYFSACLTLTLGYKYKTDKNSGKCYFVDPFYILHSNDYATIIRNLIELPFCFSSVKKIQKKMGKSSSFKDLLALVSFYREYKKLFDKKLLLEAEYICHENANFHTQFPTDEDKLNYAKTLVKKYAEASLVITSRIHCALPCLGLETPVIYVQNKQQAETSSCRLHGLIEFFNIIDWDNGKLAPQFLISNKITSKTIINNKHKHNPYIENLIQICKNFTKGNN